MPASTTPTTIRRGATRAGVGLALLALAVPAQARPLGPDGEGPAYARSTTYLTPVDVHDPPRAGAPSGAPTVTIVREVPPVQAAIAGGDTGFDWTDAAIGAAAAGGVMALLGAGLIATNRGRRREHTPHAAH